MKFAEKFLAGTMLVTAAMFAACGDDSSSSPAPESSSVIAPESSSVAVPESSSEALPTSSSAVVPESSSEALPTSSSVIAPESSATVGDTVWNKANLTWYTSWPEPGSEECEDYNGCTWAGWFAGLEDQQTEEWVSEHNIIAVHEKDWNTYRLKTLRLKQNGHVIDAVVYDKCADSDCNGCCTANANQHGYGFLIDIESYSCERFAGRAGDCDGMVQWTCLDCD